MASLLDPLTHSPTVARYNSALAIAKDFESVYNAVLEGARVFARICRLTLVRSRAMEDCPTGAWG